jgi:transcriptional regulator GlxA family with amidase domain
MSGDRTVAILCYEGVQLSAVSGLEDMFEIATRISAGLDGGRLSARRWSGAETLDSTPGCIVVPPNIRGARGAGETGVHAQIRTHHARGGQLCAACAGVFWLGHAGLLAGRPVTTHWALEQEFAAAFPEAGLHPEHILIDDHDIVTAGGMMAWLDLGLFLVERHLGGEAMLRTARHLLIDPRGREQRHYRRFAPALDHGDRAIRGVQDWMEASVGEDLVIRRLAEQAGLSERTFVRRFGRATGLSPNAYVQELRIERAKGLLERTREPVQQIAWRVGYHDLSAFNRTFRQIAGQTPGEFRRRFHVA